MNAKPICQTVGDAIRDSLLCFIRSLEHITCPQIENSESHN